MYKLIIDNNYKLYKCEMFNQDKLLLGAFNSVEAVCNYNKLFLNNFIRESELHYAIKFISNSMHNTCEFGSNGYFTVSYYDKSIKE